MLLLALAKEARRNATSAWTIAVRMDSDGMRDVAEYWVRMARKLEGAVGHTTRREMGQGAN